MTKWIVQVPRASDRSARQVELGSRIRARRVRLGLSQERLALSAGIERTYTAQLEAGRRNPSLETMSRVAIALGVDLGTLVKGLQELPGREE